MTSTFFDRYKATIWCKSCGRKALLMPEHLAKLADRIPFSIDRLDSFTTSKAAHLFRCSECNQKNSEFIIEAIAEEPSPQVETPPPKRKRPKKRRTGNSYISRDPIRRGPGLCIRCGEPIPGGRLKAVPGTRLCTGCQKAEEL
jgi:hypothetical protein